MISPHWPPSYWLALLLFASPWLAVFGGLLARKLRRRG